MNTRVDRDMNCEDFRTSVAADPSFDGGVVHAATCADCTAWQKAMQALDLKIAKALAISVPQVSLPELPEIDASNVVGLPRKKRAPVWFALAASVLIAAVVGIRMVGDDVPASSLADQILAHIDHEPNALRVTSTPVSEQRLRSVVRDDVARLDREAALITYAQSCPINGRIVPHLVIQGEHGPVTILLMPDEYIAEATTISGESISGVILPVGKGSIAIVGEYNERLDEIQKSVVNSVTWET